MQHAELCRSRGALSDGPGISCTSMTQQEEAFLIETHLGGSQAWHHSSSSSSRGGIVEHLLAIIL